MNELAKKWETKGQRPGMTRSPDSGMDSIELAPIAQYVFGKWTRNKHPICFQSLWKMESRKGDAPDFSSSCSCITKTTKQSCSIWRIFSSERRLLRKWVRIKKGAEGWVPVRKGGIPSNKREKAAQEVGLRADEWSVWKPTWIKWQRDD